MARISDHDFPDCLAATTAWQIKNLARALPLPAISKPLALTGAGLTHDQRPYPGVDHAVINDTGARYNATQATAALTDVENWFRTHLT